MIARFSQIRVKLHTTFSIESIEFLTLFLALKNDFLHHSGKVQYVN